MFGIARFLRLGPFLLLVLLPTSDGITSSRPTSSPKDAAAAARDTLVCLITLPGDVNNNGQITTSDIIQLIGYVFKNGMAPVPCEAAGDVNCDGVVTSGDIIYLVNFVLKSGALPCDICHESPLAVTCN